MHTFPSKPIYSAKKSEIWLRENNPYPYDSVDYWDFNRDFWRSQTELFNVQSDRLMMLSGVLSLIAIIIAIFL